MRLHYGLFLAVGLSASAFAQTPSAAEAAAKQASAKGKESEGNIDPDKVKCRYIYELNSRIPSRVCRTQAEWARIAEENRQNTEAQMRSGGNSAESGTIYGSKP